MVYENLNTELVNALIENGRASLRSLAEELDVSVTTISNHLSDLEERGVIEGYTPIVEHDKLGYDVTERLQGHKQMVSIYEVTGEFDIVGIGKFCDTDDMNSLIKNSSLIQTSSSHRQRSF